jgi:hypothetical protein
MSTIMEMLNAGIGGLNTPLGQLGINMLAQSGPQQGNPGGGQRLGQAFAGMQQQQNQQLLQQYRQAQIQQAEEQRAFLMQQARAKAEQQQRQQQAFADPNLQAQLGPMAKQLASLGIDPEMILKANSGDALQAHRAAQLQQQSSQFAQTQARLAAGGGGGGQPPGPKVPTPRQVLEEPLENGMLQKHIFDPATNAYKPYGKPYRQYAPGKADPMQDLLGGQTPGDGADLGQLPGNAPLSSYTKQPMQGAELLMHGSGSNPMARPPSQTSAKSPATPKTKADYDALPAGAAYIDPASGKVAVKRGA